MRRMICIIGYAKVESARSWLALQYGGDPLDYFVAGLNASGKHGLQITHYAFDWAMSETDYMLISAELSKEKYSPVIIEEGSARLDDEDGKPSGRSVINRNGLLHRGPKNQ